MSGGSSAMSFTLQGFQLRWTHKSLSLSFFLGVLASLLAIVNPPIAIPIFVALSANLKPIERDRQALRVAINVATILLAVLLSGSLILKVFGISLGAVRVAGGLIIAFLGFRMLFPAIAHGSCCRIVLFKSQIPQHSSSRTRTISYGSG